MNIVVFASDSVGFGTIEYLLSTGDAIAGVVLDSKDKGQRNSELVGCLTSRSPDTLILYSDTVYAEESLKHLRRLEPDLFILAWWPYIIKRELIEIPKIGVLNFHPSYLPYNRGRNYNFWTLVEDTPFGVSIHWVDEGIDSGAVAYQANIAKTWLDTGETLYSKASAEMLQLFKRSWPRMRSGDIPRVQQDLSLGSSHRGKELEEASRIDLDKMYSGRELLNVIRARTFPPHPGAWFLDEGKKYEVRITISEAMDATAPLELTTEPR